ncbi:MAG: TIGR02206 family membrane protein [Rhodothermales bacterium]
MNASTAFLKYNTFFTTFGTQHLLVMGLTLLSTVALPLFANRLLAARQKLFLARLLTTILSLTVILWTALRLLLGDFEATTDLPLDICNLSALLLPFLMWRPSKRLHNILYFWVLVGTVQAVLTPHLINGYPNFTFFKYWIVHGGLIVCIVYFTASFNLYPGRKSIFTAFAWIQVYAVAVYLANLLLGSNYFYIMRKPPTASLLDVFGPWPWYILVCEGLTLVLFILAYLPIAFIRRNARLR